MDITSTTENVSTGGAYFLSSSPFKSGMKLDVSLTIPYEISGVIPPRVLETEASVVRVVEPENLHQSRHGIAIKFLKDLEMRSQEFQNV
jgi:hypothetical protein